MFKRQRLIHHTTATISIIWAMAFVVAVYSLPPQLGQACEQPLKLAGTLMFGITTLVPIMISTDACSRMKESATALGIPNV